MPTQRTRTCCGSRSSHTWTCWRASSPWPSVLTTPSCWWGCGGSSTRTRCVFFWWCFNYFLFTILYVRAGEKKHQFFYWCFHYFLFTILYVRAGEKKNINFSIDVFIIFYLFLCNSMRIKWVFFLMIFQSWMTFC